MDEEVEFANSRFVNILQARVKAAEGEEDEPGILAIAPLDLEVGHVDSGPEHTKRSVVSVMGLVRNASSLVGLFNLAVAAKFKNLLNRKHKSAVCKRETKNRLPLADSSRAREEGIAGKSITIVSALYIVQISCQTTQIQNKKVIKNICYKTYFRSTDRPAPHGYKPQKGTPERVGARSPRGAETVGKHRPHTSRTHTSIYIRVRPRLGVISTPVLLSGGLLCLATSKPYQKIPLERNPM